MKTHFGKTKHIRKESKGADEYKWYTFQDGDVIPDELGLKFSEIEEEPQKSKKTKSKIRDFVEDILDDGKRNYSNDPKKKSPGRKRGKR